MNDLPLRPLMPDTDAPLMTPSSASYCEIGFTAVFLHFLTTDFYEFMLCICSH